MTRVFIDVDVTHDVDDLTRQPHKSCQALTLYLDNLAPSGRRSMRSLLQQVALMQGWSGTLETMPWSTLLYQDVVAIRNELKRNKKSANTINTTLAAIRGVLKTGFLTGHYPALEWQRIQAIGQVTAKGLPAGRHLSAAELMRLFNVCHDHSVQGIRDAAILALLCYGGLRRSEVSGLDVSDYSRRTGQLRIRAGKGNKQRELLLPMPARSLLRHWLQHRGSSPGALFRQLANNGNTILKQAISAQGIYYLLQRRAKQAGIAHCSPHDLRRTFVTRLLEQGVDFNTTRQLAGHEHLQTTALYDRRNIKTQRQAMANFSF